MINYFSSRTSSGFCGFGSGLGFGAIVIFAATKPLTAAEITGIFAAIAFDMQTGHTIYYVSTYFSDISCVLQVARRRSQDTSC
jgi:hypothetical protein